MLLGTITDSPKIILSQHVILSISSYLLPELASKMQLLAKKQVFQTTVILNIKPSYNTGNTEKFLHVHVARADLTFSSRTS